ncbi:RluA family pseudouridine synthase [Pleionea sediminis]|uniref:RluA family pseudouridine synthase n=1 Tax=Pleionea sediminis TaxID=2569479 RepID=UPI0011854249|nr:RluA family pseudouridine synthase [Pleionea sediminis]
MPTIPEHWINYIDDDLIVIDKPSGLPSVPGKTPAYTQNLYHWLNDEIPPVYVVHRLDINTSGLIVFARTKAAQRTLSIAFQKRKTKKIYRALLHGYLKSHSGKIELPIVTDWENRPRQKLCFISGKASMTEFKRLSYVNDNTLVEFRPITGRSHQLRIHAQLIGHPIVGCRLYGFGTQNEQQRLMLHAQQLTVPHPSTNSLITFLSLEKFLE